jgi:asparagine synthase (glutamine-hydrolysing)
MCGILGSFCDKNLNEQIHRAQSAIKLLHHRGPDDKGLETFSISTNQQLALGQTRLSIIDLSMGGHQPMHSPDKRYTIIFNGEIYNYRELRKELEIEGKKFITDSDTEVLLNSWIQWGKESLKRLTGMFAFAVFDKLNETLTLVRDAFGIKPLYYIIIKNEIYFASELPALLQLLPNIQNLNYQTAYNYLVCGQYDNSPETFYKEIKHLAAGNLLIVDLKQLAKNQKINIPNRWWYPSIEENKNLSFKDAAKKVREIFLKNVRLHLRSDVPIGAALSGGIDSSAIVCAIRHLEPDIPINTFSYVASDSNINEEKWIDIVNNHIGAISHKIYVKPEELLQDIDKLIYIQGEPFGSTSIYAQYRIFQAAKEAGITVLLEGQGADELFGGYEGYAKSYLKSMKDLNRYVEILKYLYNYSKLPGRGFKKSFLLFCDLIVPEKVKFLIFYIIKKIFISKWFNKSWIKKNNITNKNSSINKYKIENQGRRLVEHLRIALTGVGLNSLLRHSDRSSMNWSIENRVPFLTIEMAEFILSLPETYLISQKGETKSIFREAMRGLVPDVILDRKDKIGFQTPEQIWLNKYKDKIKHWFKENSNEEFLNTFKINKEINIELEKKYDYSIWRLINYSIWLNKLKQKSFL